MDSTTLLESWKEFEREEVPNDADLKVRRLVHWAFYSGAQASLILSAEAMGSIRDEINDMKPITK